MTRACIIASCALLVAASARAQTQPPNLTGVWAPDGRSVEPLLALDSDSRTSLLSSFHNLDAQGAWTLTLKDVSPGDVSQLVSWSLEVTGQVPEPSAALLWLTAAPGLWWMLRGRTKPLRNGPSPFPPS